MTTPPTSEAERLLRLTCTNLIGTSLDEQSSELADISLAIESAFASLRQQLAELKEISATAMRGHAAALEQLAERDAQLAEALPYMQAIRKAHNGYDPEARKVMENLKEPATPQQALDELNQEHESECDEYLAKLSALTAENKLLAEIGADCLARRSVAAERIRSLTAERDRLREALQEIKRGASYRIQYQTGPVVRYENASLIAMCNAALAPQEPPDA